MMTKGWCDDEMTMTWWIFDDEMRMKGCPADAPRQTFHPSCGSIRGACDGSILINCLSWDSGKRWAQWWCKAAEIGGKWGSCNGVQGLGSFVFAPASTIKKKQRIRKHKKWGSEMISALVHLRHQLQKGRVPNLKSSFFEGHDVIWFFARQHIQAQITEMFRPTSSDFLKLPKMTRLWWAKGKRLLWPPNPRSWRKLTTSLLTLPCSWALTSGFWHKLPSDSSVLVLNS